MPGKKKAKSKFYLSADENSSEHLELDSLPALEPELIEGEIIASKAEKVLRLQAYNSTGETGNLYCTNFRICFVTVLGGANNDTEANIHKFIGANDIVLCNITAIYQISGDRKKRLSRHRTNTVHPKRVQIHTKDVGIHCFSFENTDKKDRGNLVMAILHHSSPKTHPLLFAYEFSKTVIHNGYGEHAGASIDERKLVGQWMPNLYNSKSDLEIELTRLGATPQWRVTLINSNFEISSTMPEYFAVPAQASDQQLCEAASQYTGNRLPMWLYTHTNGYSLITMSTLTPETVHVSVEKRPGLPHNRLIESIKQSQPPSDDKPYQDPMEINLMKAIASISEIQTSFQKMFALCAPESAADFHSSDNNFYSQLDACHWLRYVCSSLRVAKDAARRIRKGVRSVIIKDDLADLSCLVSCLVQILLDDSCRTIRGFQNIVQRCWVAAGHPFCQRLNVLWQEDENITPVFLLFLDCVYQLTVQYPSSFEFSEIYLISLWDSCVTGLFKEFIFDCNKDRSKEKMKPVFSEHSTQRTQASTTPIHSTWNWNIQYSSDYMSLFRNPLYEFISARSERVGQPHPRRHKVLKPNCHPSQIDVWIGCFYRNTAPMQITNGGKPAEYFQQCLLMEEVTELQNQLAKLESGATRTSVLYFQGTQTSSERMLAKLKSSFITSTFPFNNSISRNVSDISLCTLLEHSLVLSDHVDDDDS